MKIFKKIWINNKKGYNKNKRPSFQDIYDGIIPNPSFNIDVVDVKTQILQKVSSDEIFTIDVTSADGTIYKVIINPSLLCCHTEGIIMNQRSNQLTIKTVNQDLQNFKTYTMNEFAKISQEFVNVNNRIDQVEARLDNKIDQVEIRLNKKIDDVEIRLNNKIDDVEARLNKKIDDVEVRLNKKIDDVKNELNAKMDKGFEEIKTLIVQLQKPSSTI